MNTHISQKERRQKVITELLRTQKIATQSELLEAVEEVGIHTTQASLSRDIAELGILKEGNHYVLHPSSFYQGAGGYLLSIHQAGPNLLVIKTAAGTAPLVGSGIDEAKMEGIVGTIAGDDTVFVAIANTRKSTIIKKEIWHKFRPAPHH